MKYFASEDPSPWNCKEPLSQCTIYSMRTLSWEHCSGWELQNCFNSNFTGDSCATLEKSVNLLSFIYLKMRIRLLPHSLDSWLRLSEDLKPGGIPRWRLLNSGLISSMKGLTQFRRVRLLSLLAVFPQAYCTLAQPYVWGVSGVLEGYFIFDFLIWLFWGNVEFIITKLL